MDLEGIILSEISQTEKDKHCMISLKIMPSKSIHVAKNGRCPVLFIAANGIIVFFFMAE